MKVKLLIGRSGPAGSFKPGDVIDVSEAEAKRLFETSPPKAAPVRDGAEAETADAKSAGASGRKRARKV